MNNQKNEIQVSVCVVTYNQEKYISECLDSLINQKTDFNFEIIVGEDCSTDGTRAIVQQYAEKYPNLIVPLLYEKNVGGVENIKQVYKKAQGKYIAHMDGDDLALPYKLQKQFDILEANMDCNVCSHDVYQIGTMSEPKKASWNYPEGKYDLFDLYHKLPFFSHSSKMFINKYDSLFWDNLLNASYMLDIDIHIANLEDGNIYHISDYLGVYRVGSGISNKDSKVSKILPIGAERAFEKGLVLFKSDKIKLNTIRELYALSMLQCAYNYATHDKDEELFNLYVNKSIEQSKIGIKQNIFKIARIYPSIFFKLISLRNKIKNL